jgi:hypothetical protein
VFHNKISDMDLHIQPEYNKYRFLLSCCTLGVHQVNKYGVRSAAIYASCFVLNG